MKHSNSLERGHNNDGFSVCRDHYWYNYSLTVPAGFVAPEGLAMLGDFVSASAMDQIALPALSKPRSFDVSKFALSVILYTLG